MAKGKPGRPVGMPDPYRGRVQVQVPDAVAEAREAALMAQTFGEIEPGDISAEERLMLAEYQRRQLDPLKLFRPTTAQYAFLSSQARKRLIYGGHRTGKTLTSAFEAACIVRGCHPYRKYPERDGKLYIVGMSGKHIADPLWTKLSKPGAFFIIKDDHDDWKPVVPDMPSHKARKDQWKPAPPMIPPSLIKDISWENKNFGIPAKVMLKNGWEILFFSGDATPVQGVAVDVVWFDEEIRNEAWYDDLAVRGTSDRHGSFFWSATPQHATQKMFDLYQLAETGENENVQSFMLHPDQNIYMPKDEFKEMLSGWNEEQAETRYHGKFAILALRVYPEFDRKVHCVPFFSIPDGWTRYMGLDPGHMVCAAVFIAVPPPNDPDHGEYLYVYDEIWLKNCLPRHFAKELADRTKMQEFEAFVIDHTMGRQVRSESGQNVEELYAEAMKVYGIQSRQNGTGFYWGCADIKARENNLHDHLHIRGNGLGPKLRVFEGQCPRLCKELEGFLRKKIDGKLTDERNKRGIDAVEALEYLSAHTLGYVPRKVSVKRQKVSAVEAARQRDEDARKKRQATFGRQKVRLGGEVMK